MSSEKPKSAPVDVEALMARVEKQVEEKKAQGLYDPAEVRKVEQAALTLSRAADDGAEAEISLHAANLQKLWDAKLWGVTSHRFGAAAKIILALKKLIYKLTKFPLGVWLASQIRFNDELVKLLNVLVPQHLDLRHRMTLTEERLDQVEDLARQLLTDLSRVDKENEVRLSALEREMQKGGSRSEELLARLQGLLEKQAQTGAVSAEAAAQVGAERVRARGASYLAFEDMHRGLREEIKKRQEVYLPFFAGAVSREAPLLDLGCGRGEFLELCSERGVTARGIDLNPDMAALCRNQGLEVEEAEALEYLRGLDDESLGGILASQLIEHLTLDDLMELVSLCAAKLKPGGILAAETINPQCLTTFSGAFYLDLTHIKPIHPEAARFLWRWAGLGEIEVLYLSPYPPDHRLERFSEEAGGLAASYNRNMERLNQLLYGFQDFAVLGRK